MDSSGEEDDDDDEHSGNLSISNEVLLRSLFVRTFRVNIRSFQATFYGEIQK